MKKLIFAAALLLAASMARAESFTLTSNQSGLQYQCVNGLNQPPTTDPACVTKVSSFCGDHTSYTSAQCFDKATQQCRGSNAKFADCVTQTADYCERNTSFNGSQCFDRALDACHSSALAITELMEARAKSLK